VENSKIVNAVDCFRELRLVSILTLIFYLQCQIIPPVNSLSAKQHQLKPKPAVNRPCQIIYLMAWKTSLKSYASSTCGIPLHKSTYNCNHLIQRLIRSRKSDSCTALMPTAQIYRLLRSSSC